MPDIAEGLLPLDRHVFVALFVPSEGMSQAALSFQLKVGPRKQLADSMIREESRCRSMGVDFPGSSLAPFSQTSNGRDFGLAQAQLTHAKPWLLFWCSRRRAPRRGTRLRINASATAFAEPHPPAGPL